MLVEPRISECFGLPWSALVCITELLVLFGIFGTFDLDDFDDLGYLLWSALVYIDLP